MFRICTIALCLLVASQVNAERVRKRVSYRHLVRSLHDTRNDRALHLLWRKMVRGTFVRGLKVKHWKPGTPYKPAKNGPRKISSRKGIRQLSKLVLPSHWGTSGHRNHRSRRKPANDPFDPTATTNSIHASGPNGIARTRAGISTLAAGYVDRKGYIHFDDIEARFGVPAANFLRSITERKKLDLHGVHRASFLRGLSKRAQREFLKRANLTPSLDTITFLSSRKQQKHFKNVRRLFGRTHFRDNTLSLLVATGIPFHRMTLWGKTSSTDARISAALTLGGAEVEVGNAPYSAYGTIAKELASIKQPSRIKKPIFLLLDDGGTLITEVANLVATEFPSHSHLFAAVEQTTRGKRRLSKLELPFPVIDVAGSWAKNTFSAPVYGVAIVKSALRHLRDYASQGVKFPKRATVIGYGPIGRSVARALKKQNYDVLVHDHSPTARRRAMKDGFQVEKEKSAALSENEVLFSAVGNEVLNNKSFAHLPKRVVAFNAASPGEFGFIWQGPVSFAQAKTRGAGRTHTKREWAYQWHMDHAGTRGFVDFDGKELIAGGIDYQQYLRVVTDGRKQVLLPRRGQPINFPQTLDEGEGIPPRYIQLTLGCLFAGLQQALSSRKPGLRPLSRDTQEKLVDITRATLAKHREKISEPKW